MDKRALKTVVGFWLRALVVVLIILGMIALADISPIASVILTCVSAIVVFSYWLYIDEKEN